MSKKFFILLEEFSKRPTAEVGESCKSVAKLLKTGALVPKAVCIPPQTLRLISKANNIDIKVYKLIQETDFNSSLSIKKTTNKLKKLIHKQVIPTGLSTEFLKIYHNYLQSSFAMIKSLQNIKGDANVIDAILEIWAESAAEALKKHQSKTTSSDKILYSSPILIKQQIDSQISGTAYTFDINDGNKKRFSIKAVWGIVNNNLKNATTYTVDSRTFLLVEKSSNLKGTNKKQTIQYTRSLESLKKQKLSETKQNKDILTNNQVSEFAKIISKISRSSIFPLEISWGLQHNIFFIDEIKRTDHVEKKTNNKIKTIKKLYISATKNQDIKIIDKHADGVCILNSGKLLSLLDEHPMKVAKSSQKKLLTEAISKTIAGYSSSLHTIYRSQNLTSREFSKLKHSRNYEEKEANPYLGLRGASRSLGQPQIFNMELDIINNLIKNNSQKLKNKVSILIPFSRSPGEISRIIKLINKKTKNLDVWMELSTPENILNLTNYPLNKLSGFVFNTKSVCNLSLGIDSINASTFSKHIEDNSFVTNLIKTTAQKITKNHKLLIDLTDVGSGIINEVIKENIDGIIVNPKVTATAKKCIINEEEKQILYGKN